MALVYHEYMGFLSLFAVAVFAAETILSPVPESVLNATPKPPKPVLSFGELPVPTPTPTPAPVVLGVATPAPKRTARKTNMTIAVLGDSMVPDLNRELTAIYPKTTFTVLNYGVGGENIDSGLPRIASNYTYLGEAKPSIVSQAPDVVVLESFGYNPYSFDEGALTRHWLAMAAIVDAIRANLPNASIVVASTIAPNWDTFGDGAAGLSFDPAGKRQKVETIKTYLENAAKFAAGEHLPFADAFHPTLTADGNGKLVYINAGDHIHPSGEGRALFGRVVAATIAANRLLE
jgi:lysophospholipase L1-like esterase